MKNIYKGSMVFILLIACALVLVGCGGSATDSNSNSSSTSNQNNTPKNDNKGGSTTASTSGDKIGVAECDEYLDKYEACISSKVPEAARAQLKSSLDTTRKSWKEIASTPEGKSGMAVTCKTAMDAAKQSMSAYGCTW